MRAGARRLAPRTGRQWEILAVTAVCAVFYLLAAHDDLLETSNHAWLLLDCIRSGRFLDYYNVVMAHENTLYYLNNAHYNILCYLIYAVWQLPVYLVCRLGHIAVSETFLMFWSKAVGTAAFAGCAVVLGRIAAALGYSETDVHFIPLFFVLNPIAFFAALIMSQYDTLCLLFLLLAVLAWLQKRYWRFSLLAGAALVFKFFPLLLFLPLLVLREKRPLRCLAHAAASLWLYLPTALLFRGRTGDMAVFNEEVIQRVFAAVLPGGIDPIPLFLLLYALLLMGCYLYRRDDDRTAAVMPWVGLTVYGLLFLFVGWHPQWLILLVPFLVLTTFAQTQRAPWIYLDVVLFLGYWLTINFNFPGQLEANLLRSGLLSGLCGGLAQAHNTLAFYLQLLPYGAALSPVLFAAPLAAAILFKAPLVGGSPGDRLSGKAEPLARAPSLRQLLWGTFAVCIPGIWLGSALFVLMKAGF